MKRKFYLDHLKVFLTVLVIFHHAGQAYGAYIVHLLLMIGLQFMVDDVWMGAFGKFVFIGTVTTIESFLLIWLLRKIPGVKKII